MPGKDGTLDAGSRDFNFVWYSKLDVASGALKTALTDSSGQEHHSTLPRGKMNPAVWNRQLEENEDHMLPAFREVCKKVREPFMSAVQDCAAPKARYYDDKILLVGDALLLVRPNTGTRFDTAAFQVLELEKAMKDQISLDMWETQVQRNNSKAELFALAYGRYFLYGPLRPSFIITLVRYVLFLITGSLRRLWR